MGFPYQTVVITGHGHPCNQRTDGLRQASRASTGASLAESSPMRPVEGAGVEASQAAALVRKTSHRCGICWCSISGGNTRSARMASSTAVGTAAQYRAPVQEILRRPYASVVRYWTLKSFSSSVHTCWTCQPALAASVANASSEYLCTCVNRTRSPIAKLMVVSPIRTT